MSELNQQEISFWGQDYLVTPYLVKRRFGNGKRWVSVSPLFLRPRFYVVRVGTKSDVGEIIEKIQDAIEDEYGPCCEEYSYSGECACESGFPAMTQWGGAVWRDLSRADLIRLGVPVS